MSKGIILESLDFQHTYQRPVGLRVKREILGNAWRNSQRVAEVLMQLL